MSSDQEVAAAVANTAMATTAASAAVAEQIVGLINNMASIRADSSTLLRSMDRLQQALDLVKQSNTMATQSSEACDVHPGLVGCLDELSATCTEYAALLDDILASETSKAAWHEERRHRIELDERLEAATLALMQCIERDELPASKTASEHAVPGSQKHATNHASDVKVLLATATTATTDSSSAKLENEYAANKTAQIHSTTIAFGTVVGIYTTSLLYAWLPTTISLSTLFWAHLYALTGLLTGILTHNLTQEPHEILSALLISLTGSNAGYLLWKMLPGWLTPATTLCAATYRGYGAILGASAAVGIVGGERDYKRFHPVLAIACGSYLGDLAWLFLPAEVAPVSMLCRELFRAAGAVVCVVAELLWYERAKEEVRRLRGVFAGAVGVYIGGLAWLAVSALWEPSTMFWWNIYSVVGGMLGLWFNICYCGGEKEEVGLIDQV